MSFGATNKMIGKAAATKAWKSGEEGIMKFINEIWYQASIWMRDEVSKRNAEKEDVKDKSHD